MGDIKTEYDKLFIGGKWTEPSTSEVLEVRCPATGEYFGKAPADLSIAEASYLAAIPQAPTFYSPYGKNKDKLDERKDLVLERLHTLFCEKFHKLIQHNQNNSSMECYAMDSQIIQLLIQGIVETGELDYQRHLR